MEVSMGLSAVDQLLVFLLEGKSRVAPQMMVVLSEDKMREAWGPSSGRWVH